MTLLSIIPFLNFYVPERLLRVIYRTALTNHINFNLTRIFKLAFNTFNNFFCYKNHTFVVDLFRFDHNSDFTTGLNSK